nr:hypothetical protein Iba_chr01fCG1150 [Ipomoea batatas]
MAWHHQVALQIFLQVITTSPLSKIVMPSTALYHTTRRHSQAKGKPLLHIQQQPVQRCKYLDDSSTFVAGLCNHGNLHEASRAEIGEACNMFHKRTNLLPPFSLAMACIWRTSSTFTPLLASKTMAWYNKSAASDECSSSKKIVKTYRITITVKKDVRDIDKVHRGLSLSPQSRS